MQGNPEFMVGVLQKAREVLSPLIAMTASHAGSQKDLLNILKSIDVGLTNIKKNAPPRPNLPLVFSGTDVQGNIPNFIANQVATPSYGTGE